MTTDTPSPSQHDPSLWISLWQQVIRPHSSLTDLENIRHAQLEMVLALVMSIGYLIVGLAIWATSQASASAITLIGFAGTGLLAYILGRTRWYRLGDSILTWSLACSGYSFIWTGIGTPVASLTSTIPIALVLGGILFRLPELILLTIAVSSATLAVSVVSPLLPVETHLTVLEAGRIAGNFFSLATLLMIMAIFRDSINRMRLDDLSRSNHKLQVIQDTLEQQVVERTQAAEKARQEAEAARNVLDAQVWENQGLMQLIEAMGDMQSVTTQANAAIRVICQQLESPVGGLFLLQGDHLQIAGSYAYPIETQSVPRVRLGEGLLGQAALEKRPTFFANPPAGYFPIESGLSSFSPQQLVCWPFCAGERVVGVLELGLMTKMSAPQHQFLEHATTSLVQKFRISGEPIQAVPFAGTAYDQVHNPVPGKEPTV